jgi:hypothetical protein
MKLLLDTCVWGGAKKTLESSGHDVVWTGDWPEDPGDEEMRVIEEYGQVLQSGAIITVEPGRIRIRPPDENI